MRFPNKWKCSKALWIIYIIPFLGFYILMREVIPTEFNEEVRVKPILEPYVQSSESVQREKCQLPIHNNASMHSVVSSKVLEDCMTIILMSYPGSSRFALLVEIIAKVTSWPFVHKVLLVWNGKEDEIPTILRNVANLNKMLQILPQSSNRLDNRWRVGHHVETPATLVMDDDLDLHQDGAQCLFDVWRASFKDSIVAIDVRSHFSHAQVNGNIQGPYGPWGYISRDTTNQHKKYSIALPRALLTTRDHLFRYDRAVREDDGFLRQIVDTLLCDDISFNFIASNLSSSRQPIVIYVKANYSPYRSSQSDDALFRKPGMKAKRQKCVNQLATRFKMSLKHRYWHVVCSVDG